MSVFSYKKKQKHSFIKKKSTTLQLLESLSEWCILRDCGKCVDLIYIDFKIAFDKGCYCKLIHKLTAYRIDGPVLKWVQSFLLNRTQQVCVDCALSLVVTWVGGSRNGISYMNIDRI